MSESPKTHNALQMCGLLNEVVAGLAQVIVHLSHVAAGRGATIRRLLAMRRELRAEVQRRGELVRQCRRHMRELDVGGHLEQSWPDFCRDTESMLSQAAAAAKEER